MLDRSTTTSSATLDEVLAEIRELRALFEQHVMAPVDEDDEMWASAVAVIVSRTPQTVRDWCEQHAIGKLDKKSRRYIVSKRKLRAFLIARFGQVPNGLD